MDIQTAFVGQRVRIDPSYAPNLATTYPEVGRIVSVEPGAAYPFVVRFDFRGRNDDCSFYAFELYCAEPGSLTG